jgi:DNA-directed RNA polymerase specialized sigma24 family protein
MTTTPKGSTTLPRRTTLPEGHDREEFFSRTGPHLGGLEGFVRHQVAYHEVMGDLVPGELTAEDVLDAVLLRAYDRFVENPPSGDILAWLKGLAEHRLAQEVRRLKTWRRRMVKVEEGVPEMPPEQAVSPKSHV